ncbi:MAG: M56 family metallopeptidase [Chitinophagaceae bacterium]|nr:M56 family metallopeptidase [Chitinophagaceae bacterium]
MATWTPILSWALICSLAQGLIIYTALRVILNLQAGLSASAKYRLSLAALSLLLLWFGLTLKQQLHQGPVQQVQPATALPALQDTPEATLLAGATTVLPSLPGVRALFPYLAAAYLAGLVFMLLRLWAGIRQLARLSTKGRAAAEHGTDQLLHSLMLKLGLRRPVRLLIAVQASVPMVTGFRKPLILLPAASVRELSSKELETILLHELAHIKRQDFLVNMLQSVVEAILFFNPFVWLISGIVRREREYCCDDLVLSHTGGRLDYARALTTVAGLDKGALAMAAGGRPGHLMLRIRRIVEPQKGPFSFGRMAAALLILVLITMTASRASYSFAMIRSELIDGSRASGNNAEPTGADSEELRLVAQLRDDRLIDEAKGFVIERKGDLLLVDYKALPASLARKYLAPLRKKEMHIQVYPLQERIKRHPGSSLLQLAAPIQLSSPCVDYSVPKEDC